MRINKYISHNSTHSRREADELVKNGRVKINDKIVSDLSTIVGEEDAVTVDDKKIVQSGLFTVIVYSKPKGEIVSKNDPQGRKTIYDSLPKKYSHFIYVGRLDYASEGVLLMTDSPKIADSLSTSNLERVYLVKIKGEVTHRMEEAMQRGLELDDATKGAHEKSPIDSMSFAPFYAYTIIKSTPTYSKLRIAIGEGKNREIRRFFAYFDAEVSDLKRVAFGGVELNNLPLGKTRFLSTKEYENLKGFLGEKLPQPKKPTVPTIPKEEEVKPTPKKDLKKSLKNKERNKQKNKK